MKLYKQVKPLSYVKAHAPEILEGITQTGNPVVITVRGEAVAVLQDMRSYEEMQNTLALWRALSVTKAKARKGDSLPLREAFAKIRKRVKQ